MRCFAWIELAVQALQVAIECIHRDSADENRGDKTQHGKNEKPTPEEGERRESIGYTKELEMTATIPGSWPSRLGGEFKDDSESLETVMQVCNDEKPWNNNRPHRDSLQQPLIAKPEETEKLTIRPISSNTQPLPVRRSSKVLKRISIPKEALHDSSLAYDYNPAIVAYVSSGRTHHPKTLKRRQKSSTSTIFLNSPLAPVTIIVTTPEEDSGSETDSPVGNTFNDIRARRNGTFITTTTPPTPPPRHERSMSSDSLFTPNTSLLMPPTERQIDHRRLRKAREFREVRKFLVTFLNTKGDQFPKKLRLRMMDLYSLNESDLDPAVVKRFAIIDAETGNRDEGVALEQQLEEGSDADDLRVLENAFRSQIKDMTPVGVDLTPMAMPVPTVPTISSRSGTLKRRSTLGRRFSLRKETVAATATVEDENPSTWLGPMSSESTSSVTPESEPCPPAGAQPPQTHRHRLLKSVSEPNFKRKEQTTEKAPPMPNAPIESALTSPVKARLSRGRNNTLSGGGEAASMEGHLERQMMVIDGKEKLVMKKQNLIAGAFGAVREAMLKRRLMREAREGR